MPVQPGGGFNLKGIEGKPTDQPGHCCVNVSSILSSNQFRGTKEGPCKLRVPSVCTGLENIQEIESPGTRAVPLVLLECLKISKCLQS